MDKTTRKIVKYLKTLPNYTYYWQTENRQTILPDAEFKSCAEFMMQNGYAEKVTSFGNSGGFKLSHRYIHEREFKKRQRIEWWRTHWIDLSALIISTIALLKSYETKIASVILWCKQLLEQQ